MAVIQILKYSANISPLKLMVSRMHSNPLLLLADGEHRKPWGHGDGDAHEALKMLRKLFFS